jgi:glycosyltransferase involved in cell wall biosynthesis
MARLAWFTPLPPERSGIAAYNAALLPFLAAEHELDVYVGSGPPPRPASKPGASVGRSQAGHPADAPDLPPRLTRASAHDFVWRHALHPYDLVVYQLGNAACHDFIWPHLARYPGLVVLHDGQLHHARARRLLTVPAGASDEEVRRGRDMYRAEFHYNHPGAPPGITQLVIDTLAGSIYYFYPMLRWVVRTARLVAVHSPGLAGDLSSEHPGAEICTLRHGMTDPVHDGSTRRARALRARYGVPGDVVLFAAFGLVTPEKRIPAILRAFAALPDRSSHLLLAGGTVEYYDPVAEARRLGVAERVHVTGYVPDDDLDAHVVMADVCLSLRWPSGRETSGTWLRALAAGKPTVVTDLAHGGEVPSLDPRNWAVLPAPFARPGTPAGPACVSVSLTDEQAQLLLAMGRLQEDARLRAALGAAARTHWSVHHTMDASVQDYRAALARGLDCPPPRVHDLPRHLRPDPLGAARQVAAEWGVGVDLPGM